MTKRKKLMIELVKDEAKKLKKIATKEELSKLDFNNLFPTSPSRCIYGQITGDCFSERAGELIIECAKRVYNYIDHYSILRDLPVNGKPKELEKSYNRGNFYFSPIEVFIDQRDKNCYYNNKILVSYLRGEINRLNFK